MTHREAERRAENAGRWGRGDQHCRRCEVGFEVLLDNQPTHRVTDHDWRLGQGRRRFGDVCDVVGDPVPAQALAVGVGSVTAEVDRLHQPAAVGEVTEEMLLPTPCTMPGAMHE